MRSSDSAAASNSAPSSARAEADTDNCADEVTDAFRQTYAGSGGRAEGDPADWSAFVSVLADLTPPEGSELDHEPDAGRVLGLLECPGGV